jgi:hypothetical protein
MPNASIVVFGDYISGRVEEKTLEEEVLLSTDRLAIHT